MAKRSKRSKTDADRQRDSGQPGGGAGRRDEVGGSGVYPASAGNAPADAEIRTPAAWGQGERGAQGYEDSGPSELYFTEEELRTAKEQRRTPASGAEPEEPRKDSPGRGK